MLRDGSSGDLRHDETSPTTDPMKPRPDSLQISAKPNGSGVCKHSSTEHLGFKDDVSFLRCLDCAHVLVLQGGRRWAIPPSRS